MEKTAYRAIAIVGTGAVLPDAPNVPAFWDNVKRGQYCISEVRPERWDPALYYDPDPNTPDKSYSKIGGWVRDHVWEPVKWRLAIPPRVVDAMDEGQKWAISCTREALQDYGYPERPLNLDRTAVILGNAMAGEKHYLTALRIYFPEYTQELDGSASFATLPAALRRDIRRELQQRVSEHLPAITEDTMPGELANCLAGRVANVFNIHGPNYVVDAACASAMAAISAAAEGLLEHDFDAAVTGGIDRNMGASSFVKFCKIGALSATGSRPYADGADGFVMGEGAAIFLLKRLADAERDGDRIYAVLRGMGASSDGKGKGITAPNPLGQRLAIERAWENAGLSPATATLIEGHGTSTRVGDVVEVQSLIDALAAESLPAHTIALGSVKSNVGHLKAAAGAAGFLKTVLALRDKVLPPSVNFQKPNPDIEFSRSPLYVNTELRPWSNTNGGVRRGAVSAFGFGGTNFHAVLEEHIPHRLTGNGKRSKAESVRPSAKAPLRGAVVIGASTEAGLSERLRELQLAAGQGSAPAPAAPLDADLDAPERVAIDYADAAELADKSAKALKALAANEPAIWKGLRSQGIFRGQGPAAKIAFLYTGQGSQYVNMLKALRDAEPIVAHAFAEADGIMAPLLGKALSDFIFVDESQPGAVAQAEENLRQTAVTQPAVLAADLALTRLLAAYGIEPDMTMGHSLGEYGALVASGALPFEDALEAVSARGREMTRVSVADNGRMAAVFAPIDEIERILETIGDNVVIANINSNHQSVIGGASKAVEQAMGAFERAGYNVVALPVSHAFHTSIVAPASEPLRQLLTRLRLSSPRVPAVANISGQFYPTGPDVAPRLVDLLARQVASPVQFVKGLHTLYDAGARVFVEVGPKKALQGFVEDVLGDRADVVALFTNHPKTGDLASFNQALCGLYAAGLGHGQASDLHKRDGRGKSAPSQSMRNPDGRDRTHVSPVAITGAALGLPGTERIFDDGNVARILRGEQFIDVVPARLRRAMLDKHITRLVKSETGEPTFERIEKLADVVKLAGRGGAFDPEKEFGIPAERLSALDRTTCLAMAAGIDALRDAGIPLALRYKTTSTGSQLPDRWMLPDPLRDDTGVIFASAFPGCDSFADETARYYADAGRREQLSFLEKWRARFSSNDASSLAVQELDRQIDDLRAMIEKHPYVFDRRFIFRILAMGHSQLAEFIGARGPNTHLNAACASTTQAVALAEDWIAAGRCRRVIVVAADDVTSDHLLGWMGSAFLASGVAATDEVVEDAALPFDRRRHGMICGMGAAALVIESAEAARERGIRPICEVLSTVTANSAFHGTRLDVSHIGDVMERVVTQAEERTGTTRREMAQAMVFVSHETYTPARGGSASAEIHALRCVFGGAADRIVIANTKGFTGHAMAVGIEDVVAVKALETGWVPPVANFKEVDPELGVLNLSNGGVYPIRYALRLGAGFGSQISMTLTRFMGDTAVRPSPHHLGFGYRIADEAAWKDWLSRMAGGRPADLETVNRTLRIRDGGAPARIAEPVLEVQAAAVAAPPPKAEDPVKQQILALVAEKTGYPADMLEVDLDLEADLGVDTVKQAEVFAAVRQAYGIARDDKLRLRDFPTLAHVIRFVHERRQDAAPPPAAAPVIVAPDHDPVKERILALVVEKTGYSADMLDTDLDLEADLGIDTVKQAEMFASVRAAFDIPREANLKLRDFPTLAHVIQFVRDRQAPKIEPVTAAIGIPRRVPAPVLRPALPLCKTSGIALRPGVRVLIAPDRGGVAEALRERLTAMGVQALNSEDAVDGPVHGVYWLPALDDEGPLDTMDLGAWREALRVRVKKLHTVMRRIYDQNAFLVSATRLGGQHGYGEAGALAPLGGGVVGFTKTYKRERPDAHVKAVDFEPRRSAAEIAEALIQETLRDPGAIEIGCHGGNRWTVALQDRPADDGQPGMTLDRQSVFLITGAAGSIVSAITADLASAGGGTFYLLDRIPEPHPDSNPDLDRFVHDREGLKRDLVSRLAARGERPTPALVEKELAAIERAYSARSAISAIRAAGGTARYFSVDLTDANAVKQVVDQVRERSGHVDVLLHGAGVERSHLLPDKDEREFDLVFDVKADGWFNLLHAMGEMPLGAAVVFSSIAARFGNAGQADYSSANDLLCKVVSSLQRARPSTRAIAIDWSAWGGIGMAARGSVPKMMERAGIGMLEPEAAVPIIRRELTARGTRGEIVIAQSLGVLANELDATGGLDPAAVERLASAGGPMIGKISGMGLHNGLTIETTLDPTVQPFLRDHQIDGTPVLPGVMGIEAFAEAALCLLPDWHIDAIEDVNFAVPFKFYRHEPRMFTIEALFHRDGENLVAACRLTGSRNVPKETEPQVTTHFTARVRLTRNPQNAPMQRPPDIPDGAVIDAAEIYRIFFHGPAYQVLTRVWSNGHGIVGLMAGELPNNHEPSDRPARVAPRLIELCFQTAGVWEISAKNRMGLPQHVDHVRFWSAPPTGSKLYAVVTPEPERGTFDVDVVDATGTRYVQVSGYRTVALETELDTEPLKALQAAAD